MLPLQDKNTLVLQNELKQVGNYMREVVVLSSIKGVHCVR